MITAIKVRGIPRIPNFDVRAALFRFLAGNAQRRLGDIGICEIYDRPNDQYLSAGLVYQNVALHSLAIQIFDRTIFYYHELRFFVGAEGVERDISHEEWHRRAYEGVVNPAPNPRFYELPELTERQWQAVRRTAVRRRTAEEYDDEDSYVDVPSTSHQSRAIETATVANNHAVAGQNFADTHAVDEQDVAIQTAKNNLAENRAADNPVFEETGNE